ncbi:MAG: hypothetical protein WBA48_18795 [Xanthobacteraceae bacterium]
MLKPDELKDWLHRDWTNTDKCLLVLATFEKPTTLKSIRDRFISAGVRKASDWNISGLLSSKSTLAVNTPDGWEITQAGKQHLVNLGVTKASPAAARVATDLRLLQNKIKDADTAGFVGEAIRCYELELNRSAVVMSWLAAFHVLKIEVFKNHLAAFNAEAARVNPKWKPAKSLDDLGEMKEADFLDRLRAISVIGKNVKDELQACLKTRNSCGHPNSFKIGPNTVARHIEQLLLNVFNRFC